MFLLDTNICIYVLKNSYPALTEKVFSYSPAQIAMSSVTIFELELSWGCTFNGGKNHCVSFSCANST